MNVAVLGLWHLGSVTAACLAQAGHDVTGWDPDDTMLARLAEGRAPVAEPGLDALLTQGLAARCSVGMLAQVSPPGSPAAAVV